MESIEKLRTAARNMAKGRNLEEHEECNLLLVIADEIERERKQRINELNGAICERDGRIGSYERRNTELNDALKAICKHFGVSVEWSAEDAAKKVLEALERDYMRLPCDADGVPIHVGDSIEYPNGTHDVVRFITVNDNVPTFNESGWVASKCRHVKPRTVDDVMSEYAELSASQDVKKYHEVSDELREIQREQFRDEPEREFFKDFNGYEFYIELPYDELCIGTERAWVERHSYSYMYKKPNGGSVYSCSSLCGHSRDWAIGRINEEIARIESELQMRGDAE